MITARLPFPSAYSDAVVYAILNETPQPITSLRSGVPMELERIVSKALQKESAARYQHPDEMLVDLRSVKKLLESGGPPRQFAIDGKPTHRRMYRYGAIATVAALLVGSLLYFNRFPVKEKAEPAPVAGNQQAVAEIRRANSIAVLPFKNISSDKEQDYFCEGMTEQIITNLSNLQGLKVIARTSVMQFKNSETPIPEIARLLGVANVVEGSIRKSGNRIRVTAQLIKADDGFHLWANDYDRELKDIFGVQDDVSKAIVAALKLNLSAEQSSSIAKRHTENAEAYQLYLKGRFYWNKRTEEGMKKAIEYYQQAIGKDPVYALAYAGLAESYGILGYYNWLAPKEAFPRARAAAIKALEIDSALGEGHTAMAIVERDFGWNWANADKEFKRALALNPGYSITHLWYANFFNVLELHDDALAEMNKAVEIDPLSLVINADKGRTLYFARRYDESLEQLNRTLDLDPSFGLAHIWMGQVYEQKNMYENAISAYQKGLSLSDGSTYAMAKLAHAFAMAGKKNEAQKLLDQLETMSSQKYVSAFDIGVIYAGLGEKDRAFAWLEKAYEERSHWLSFLKVDPTLDPLRADARFTILLKRMGLDGGTKL
jgi:adenylate cyclase